VGLIAVRHWIRGLAVLGAIAALAAPFSCRQVAGIEDQPVTLLSMSACGLSFGTSSCASCAAASCCAESTACAADTTTCQPYEACLGDCKGDTTCRSQCALDHQPGFAAEVGPLSACLATHCEDECGLTCGGLGAFQIPPDAAAGCQSCLTANACDHERACAKSADCEATWQQCAQGCATHDCAEDCFVAHGSTTQTGTFVDGGVWPPFGNDINNRCGASCKVGNWTCAGKVSWPYPEPTVTVTFQAIEYLSPRPPIPNLDVHVCDSLKPACDSPSAPALARGQTNTDGIAVMTFANAPNAQGLGLNGFLEIESPDQTYPPSLLYWGFPLSESTAGVLWDFSTSAEVQALDSNIAHVMQEPQLGQIIVAVVDCSAGFAPQVKVSIDPGGAGITTIYGINADPTLTATDLSGLAFLFNVPPSTNVRVTATPVGMERPTSVVPVQVRAGWITNVSMYPTP
jgi:hypothetical protein